MRVPPGPENGRETQSARSASALNRRVRGPPTERQPNDSKRNKDTFQRFESSFRIVWRLPLLPGFARAIPSSRWVQDGFEIAFTFRFGVVVFRRVPASREPVLIAAVVAFLSEDCGLRSPAPVRSPPRSLPRHFRRAWPSTTNLDSWLM